MTAWSDYVDQFGLTKTEAKLFAFLADGLAHTRQDCLEALGRKVGSPPAIAIHIYKLRPKLLPHGYSIKSKRGFSSYRLIREGADA